MRSYLSPKTRAPHLPQIVSAFSKQYYFVALPLVLPVFNEGSWHGPWEVSTFPEGFSSEKSYTPGTPCGIWTGVYTFIAIAYLTVYARIFKYLRCHPGIAVYMNVFGKTFRKLDFNLKRMNKTIKHLTTLVFESYISPIFIEIRL